MREVLTDADITAGWTMGPTSAKKDNVLVYRVGKGWWFAVQLDADGLATGNPSGPHNNQLQAMIAGPP